MHLILDHCFNKVNDTTITTALKIKHPCEKYFLSKILIYLFVFNPFESMLLSSIEFDSGYSTYRQHHMHLYVNERMRNLARIYQIS